MWWIFFSRTILNEDKLDLALKMHKEIFLILCMNFLNISDNFSSK